MKKKSKLSRRLIKIVDEAVSKDLDVYNISDWKEACKSFAPITYAVNTRKQWLKINRYRIEAAREIVEFVDSWVTNFRNREEFENYTVAAMKEEVIQVIRKAQQRIKAEKGILNGVKLSGFKTLVKWADCPMELEKGPHRGSDTIPEGVVYKKRRISSSKEKRSIPHVDILKDFVVINKDRINVVISLMNKGKFPFQNVEMELKLDDKLAVISVESYAWSPRENRIRIGFIEASLDQSNHEMEIIVNLICNKRAKSYTIGGVLLFDDLVNGVRSELDIEDAVISI
ncbi:MAG: hypothetical protein ACXAB5_00785 [Candidatus Thorarchaeota archaeon]